MPFLRDIIPAPTFTAYDYTKLVPTAAEAPAPTSAPIISEDGQMVFVRGGNFIQGSTKEQIEEFGRNCSRPYPEGAPSCGPNWFLDEVPQHSTYLSAFWIDLNLVTNSQFQQFTESTGYVTDAEKVGSSNVYDSGTRNIVKVLNADWRHPQGQGTDIADKGNYPVTQVSADDAAAYCTWAGKRLPTEAEWEKAARGTDGRIFPWGSIWNPNENPAKLNFPGAVQPLGLKPVGAYPDGKSPYGAMDMLGELFQWTSDYYDEHYYEKAPSVNPNGPDIGSQKVKRGGSWASNPSLFHIAWRQSRPAKQSDDSTGFRCARIP
jgi:serine/threonine-protein kinase